MINGKGWLAINHEARTTYIPGLENGLLLLINEMNDTNQHESATPGMATAIRLAVYGVRFGDLVAEIDLFYQQARNLRIPVVEAYRYVTKKFKGASPEERASYQATLRGQYNK